MDRARIICHRGACLTAPENTLAALEGAIALGADVIEFDIRQSKDGVLYVFHDETLERTSNGRGRFADTLSLDIDRLDAGSWFDGAFVGERIPRLETFLDSCVGRIDTYAEIKHADPARVRDMLAARGLLKSAWTFSFDPDIQAETRAKAPDLRRMVLYSHVGSVARAVASGAHILEFHPEDITFDRVREAKDAGLITQMFYDGDDQSVFETALECGVEQFNIDHVDRFREVEAQRQLVSVK